MAAIAEGKYQLRSLHEEIALFDRKLNHLLKYETFETDSTRDAAAKKLKNKRDLLAKTARRLAAEGVEFQQSELPPSFLVEDAQEAEAPSVAAGASSVPVKSRKSAGKTSVTAAAPMLEVLSAGTETQRHGISDAAAS